MIHKHAYNTETVKAYNDDAKTYIQKTPATYQPYQTLMVEWIDTGLSLLQPGAKIFEIGSAIPRDARYMRQHGFTVQCSDAAENFVKHLRLQGEDAFRFNVLFDPLATGYDMIFANSVVTHFTPEELDFLFQKVYDALPQGGIFAFNVKQGTGDAWLREKIKGRRYTHYWQLDDLIAAVKKRRFEVVYHNTDDPGDFPGVYWSNIIVRK